ncbi:hypothetical protein DEU56DRAFT_750064 [Suillus clintonianus]|uniref:uncharacterized protein n=1 Tax=Suillus clintonianus TaxID=1904413 RepID=UPI001B8868E4|nr:uncharacterized protein DEU56DRAFT_750064 [Suillus clintonianus]KAG2108867.1 hypothetical protein DEU56DRAFT_750064 [Suillus clintonianus]
MDKAIIHIPRAIFGVLLVEESIEVARLPAVFFRCILYRLSGSSAAIKRAKKSLLIASLPITNYSLLRALTAHLTGTLIIQNSSVNKRACLI